MTLYRKKSSTVEAHRWWRNGGHQPGSGDVALSDDLVFPLIQPEPDAGTPHIYGPEIGKIDLTGVATLRVPVLTGHLAGNGRVVSNRSIQLDRLVEIARSEDGWEALNDLFRSRPEPPVGEVWDFWPADGGRPQRFIHACCGWVSVDTGIAVTWGDVLAVGDGHKVADAPGGGS